MESLRERRSIRRYLDRPVSEELIREVLDEARWSPSWANTQGWMVYVVTGQALTKLKAECRTKAAAKEERSFEIARPYAEWPPEMAQRTQRVMAARAAAAPDLSPATVAEFFGAPCLLLLTVDARLRPEYACFDSGVLTQSICLAAHDRGLGTCIMAMAVGYPDALHRLIPAAANQRFVVGIALGYPDAEAPINRFERERASLSEIVRWVN